MRQCGRSELIVLVSGICTHGGFGAVRDEPLEVLWAWQFGTSSPDVALAGASDSSGSAYLVGHTRGEVGGPSHGGLDAFAVKLDSQGRMLWAKQIGTSGIDVASAVVGSDTGDVVVAGATRGNMFAPPIGGQDLFVLRYDSVGDQVWGRQIGSGEWDVPGAAAMDGAGAILIAGQTLGQFGGMSYGQEDIFTMKLDGAGNQVWSRQFGTSLRDMGRGIAADHLGNVYVGGSVESSPGNSAQKDGDAILIKYDPDGDELWSRRFGTLEAGELVNGVAVNAAGEVYVCGSTFGDFAATNPDPESEDVFVAKFNSRGDMLWARQVGTLGPDVGADVAIDELGSPFITGRSARELFGPSLGFADGFVAKLTPEGEIVWGLHVGGNGSDLLSISASRPRHVTCFGITFGDLGGPNAGSADMVAIQLGSCYADCTEDGRLDVFDFLCFQDAFAHGAAYADCETDGQFDVFDFLCFQDAFVTGCD